MKKIVLLALAAIIAVMLCEIVLRYVVKYPVYGVSHKVHYRKGGEYWSNMWKPGSGYWNVEGGNVRYKRNNLGLPGNNVDFSRDHKLALLGSSYLEAYQIKPGLTAASVFDSLLQANHKNTAVYNLGSSGHDPYDSWFRLEYFKQKTDFDYVVLVLNSDNLGWFKRHPQPLSFDKDESFGRINNKLITRYIIKARNASSLITVLVGGAKGKDNKNEAEVAKPEVVTSPEVNQNMKDCIIQFSRQYKQNFVLVSIVNDEQFNAQLADFCKASNTNFINKPLVSPENLLHGAGHLNERGNLKLGKLLFGAYHRFFSNNSD